MNKNILSFFNDMYNREIAKHESIFIPTRDNLILIEFTSQKESKLTVGYEPVDIYSTNQVNTIAENIITSLLGLDLKKCNETEAGKTLGRTNGDFILKGKTVHYIVLATKNPSHGIDINISFSA